MRNGNNCLVTGVFAQICGVISENTADYPVIVHRSCECDVCRGIDLDKVILTRDRIPQSKNVLNLADVVTAR